LTKIKSESQSGEVEGAWDGEIRNGK